MVLTPKMWIFDILPEYPNHLIKSPFWFLELQNFLLLHDLFHHYHILFSHKLVSLSTTEFFSVSVQPNSKIYSESQCRYLQSSLCAASSSVPVTLLDKLPSFYNPRNLILIVNSLWLPFHFLFCDREISQAESQNNHGILWRLTLCLPLLPKITVFCSCCSMT